MTAQNIAEIVIVALVMGMGVSIPVLISWFDHRTRTKALDVLRVYAERGEEPPPSVTQALTWVSGWPKAAPAVDDTKDRIGRPRTRGGFLAHAAADAVFAAGFSWFAWWRYGDLGEASIGVMICIFVALYFAASTTARLVGAYYAAPGK